jgi:hypothetical protein
MSLVQMVTLAAAFDATGKYVPEGHIGTFDTDKITEKDKHLVDPGELPGTAMVQISPIAPTGPNPTTPQQLPADAIQGPGGGYFTPGKQLVSEVTANAETRITGANLDKPELEAEVSEALARIAKDRGIALGDVQMAAMGVAPATTENNDDKLVSGTVAEVTSDLGTKTDEQLNQLLAAENDREKPRVGVTNAIQAELDARAEQKADA